MTRYLLDTNIISNVVKPRPSAALLAWMADQGSQDKTAAASSTAATINLPEQAVNFNMGTLVGSYASVARMLDEAAGVPGTKGTC